MGHFFQNLSLLTEDFDLFTEPPELLTLLGSEPFAFSLVYLRLLYPVPESVVRDAKFPGDLGGWFVCGRVDQPNGLCFELWCIARCCSRHLWDSLRRRSHPKLWCVHRPGSSPMRLLGDLATNYQQLPFALEHPL